MTESPRNNAPKTRGRPFQKGNPGRPRGARHKATLAAEALLDGEAEALTRKAFERAKEGDATALRLCLDRILPPRKERPLRLALPALTTVSDAAAAMAAITAAVARGDITAGDPCNRCGMCCVMKPCWIGRLLFEVGEGECPALQWSAEGSSCGLLANPAAYMPVRVRIEGATRVRKAAKAPIGAGVGCVPGREAKKRLNDRQVHTALRTLGLLKKLSRAEAGAA